MPGLRRWRPEATKKTTSRHPPCARCERLYGARTICARLGPQAGRCYTVLPGSRTQANHQIILQSLTVALWHALTALPASLATDPIGAIHPRQQFSDLTG